VKASDQADSWQDFLVLAAVDTRTRMQMSLEVRETFGRRRESGSVNAYALALELVCQEERRWATSPSGFHRVLPRTDTMPASREKLGGSRPDLIGNLPGV